MKKKLLALSLSMILCLSLLPFALAAGKTYEEAVAELREVNYGAYGEEQTYEGDLCTLFSYSIMAPHGPYAHMDLVYKAGSPLGEGTVVSLPIPDGNAWGASSAPEKLDWNPEGGRLTYSYYFDSPIYREDFSGFRRAAGTFLYTVDLKTGEVTETLIPPHLRGHPGAAFSGKPLCTGAGPGGPRGHCAPAPAENRRRGLLSPSGGQGGDLRPSGPGSDPAQHRRSRRLPKLVPHRPGAGQPVPQ